MKREMPPRITIAPAAIAIALALLSPLLPDVVVVALVTVGAAVVVTVGVAGTPGESGLANPCARAAGVMPSAQPASAAASAPTVAVEKRLPTG